MSSAPYYAHDNKQPVVVQGQLVSSPYAGEESTSVPPADDWTKGEKQPNRCNDACFALLFYAHVIAMICLVSVYAPQMYSNVAEGYDFGGGERGLEGEDNEQAVPNPGAIAAILGVCFFAAFVVSALTLTFMMSFAEALIKIALWFNIVTSFLVAVAALLTGAFPVAILCFIGFALSAYYAYVVWSRIPFAASNLVTALTSVKANLGLSFFAYLSLLVLFGWTILWSVASVSIVYVTSDCSGNWECESETNGGIVFALLVSYYWTIQVIRNTVHVTVAGTVGTWWFVPLEASSCCSKGVRDSFCRAVTFSFGSICFGSLIVAIIQAAKEMVRQMRENGDGMLMACAECLLGCIEWLVEYFNKWAFVYVGLYGYSFMTAGTNVMTLFKQRGWTTIITDNLIDNVLAMVSVGVGVLTGALSALSTAAFGLQQYAAAPFVVGFVVGFVLCSTLMSVVSSGVNTVIVLYAEAPAELDKNHPELAGRMRETWRQAWPNDFRDY